MGYHRLMGKAAVVVALFAGFFVSGSVAEAACHGTLQAVRPMTRYVTCRELYRTINDYYKLYGAHMIDPFSGRVFYIPRTGFRCRMNRTTYRVSCTRRTRSLSWVVPTDSD